MEKHKPYGPYEKYFKRSLDFLCGMLAVIVFCWLYLILIILGAIFMRGNPFFTQLRPGKDEKIFKEHKNITAYKPFTEKEIKVA